MSDTHNNFRLITLSLYTADAAGQSDVYNEWLLEAFIHGNRIIELYHVYRKDCLIYVGWENL